VVEAAIKSGTLTTAAHATDQSREVFAIPGNIDNPQARGCHALLRNGATLVESVEDILIQLAPLLPKPEKSSTERVEKTTKKVSVDVTEPAVGKPEDTLEKASGEQLSTDQTATDHADLSPDMKRVLDAFDYTPLPLDTIVDTTGLDIVTVGNIAFDLELAGALIAVAGGKFVRSGTP